jgi:hypothetical protein
MHSRECFILFRLGDARLCFIGASLVPRVGVGGPEGRVQSRCSPKLKDCNRCQNCEDSGWKYRARFQMLHNASNSNGASNRGGKAKASFVFLALRFCRTLRRSRNSGVGFWGVSCARGTRANSAGSGGRTVRDSWRGIRHGRCRERPRQ